MSDQTNVDVKNKDDFDMNTPSIIKERYEIYLRLLQIFCKIRNYKKEEHKSLIKEAKKVVNYVKKNTDTSLKNSLLKKFFGSIDNEPYAETLLYDGTKDQCPATKGSPDEYAVFLQNIVKVKNQVTSITDDGLEEAEYNDLEILDICRRYADSKLYYSFFDTFHQRIRKEPDFMKKYVEFARNSITTGVIPEELLKSWTYKVPKNEKHKKSTDKNNYRPLVTFDFKSVLLQRIVLEFLIKETKDKVKGLQFAYREHYNRELHILALHQHLRKLRNEKKNYGVLFYDVAKAFNNVNHERLLRKLKQLNISKGLFNWLKTFLTKQQTKVYIGKSESQPFVPYGIPQGSPISPWLFVLYMNDIFDLFVDDDYVKMFMYADDITIAISDPDESRINNVNGKIEKWLENDALMEINRDKCNYYLRIFNDPGNKHMDTSFGKLEYNNLFQPNKDLVGYAGLQELLQAESEGFTKHVDKLVSKIQSFKHAFQAIKDIFLGDGVIFKMFIATTEFDSQILLWGIDLINRENVQKGMDNILSEYAEVFKMNPNEAISQEEMQKLRNEFNFDVNLLYEKKVQIMIDTIYNHLKGNKDIVSIFNCSVADSAFDKAKTFIRTNSCEKTYEIIDLLNKLET